MSEQDAAWFEAFVRERHLGLLQYGYVLTGARDPAADLVQDALERTGLVWARVVARGDPDGYVRKAMANRHVSLWRRTRREHLTPEDSDRPHLDPEPLDEALWKALAGLPRRQRAVLVLRYYEGLSEREIADVLGCARDDQEPGLQGLGVVAQDRRPGGIVDLNDQDLAEQLTATLRRVLSGSPSSGIRTRGSTGVLRAVDVAVRPWRQPGRWRWSWVWSAPSSASGSPVPRRRTRWCWRDRRRRPPARTARSPSVVAGTFRGLWS